MKTRKKEPSAKTKQIALTGVFAALSVAFSYLEFLLTSFLPLPPGVKPGFSNIVVMFANVSFGFPYALAVGVIKAAFSFFMSGLTAGFLSLLGGVFSITVTALMLKLKRRHGDKISYLGISVLGAVGHNTAQLIGASLLVKSFLYFSWAPVLLLSALAFGSLTGILLNAVMPALTILNRKSL